MYMTPSDAKALMSVDRSEVAPMTNRPSLTAAVVAISDSATKRKANTKPPSAPAQRKKPKLDAGTVTVAAAAVAVAVAAPPPEPTPPPPPPPPPPLAPTDIPLTLSVERVTEINRNLDGPYIHNVVAKSRLVEYENPDLIDLAWRLGGKCDMTGFSAPCKIMYREPPSIISVYRSGAVVSTGTKSPEMAALSFYAHAEYVSRHVGRPTVPRSIQIKNIHATLYTGYIVDLQRLQSLICGSTKLAIKINAVRFRLQKPLPQVTVLVYQTGSCVLTGGANRDALTKCTEFLTPVLAECFVRHSTKKEQALAKQQLKEDRLVAQANTKTAMRVMRVRCKLKRLSEELNSDAKSPNVAKGDVSAIVGVYQIYFHNTCIVPKKPSAAVATTSTLTNKRAKPTCTHEVFVKYDSSEDEKWCPLGRMSLAAMTQLAQQNGFTVPVHEHGVGFVDRAAAADSAASVSAQ